MKRKNKLSEDFFWKLINSSLENTKDTEEQEEYLTTKLKKLSIEDIVGYALILNKLIMDIHTSKIKCACYLISGEDDDDGFYDFKLWIISRGKDVYYKTKKDSDSLVNYIDDFKELDEYISLDFVATDALDSTYNLDLDDYLPKDKESPDLEIWDEVEFESLKEICPNIFTKVEEHESEDVSSISDYILQCKKELDITFEDNYIEFVSDFGEGTIGGLIRIYMPNRILNDIHKWRKRITEYWFWNESKKVLTKKQVLKSIIIGDTVSGDEIIFYEKQYYVLPRNAEVIYKIGSTLNETIEWICSEKLADKFSDRSFEPF